MKRKSFIAILLLTLLVLPVLMLSSCDQDKVEKPHEHTFAAEWTSNETHHWHAATCEHTNEVKDKAEHVWNDGEETKPATTEEAGEKTFTCTVCSYKKVENIPALEHKHTFASVWSNDATYHWYAATCEHKEEVKDKAAHTFGEWTETKAPTSNAEGEKERVCSICEYVDKEYIQATGKRAIRIISGSIDKTYDGKAVDISSDDIDYEGGTAEVVIECRAKDSTDEYSVNLPKDAGKYELKITVRASGTFEEEYALVDFEISKAPVNIGHTQYTSYYAGEWTTLFKLGKSENVIENDGVLEDVSFEIKNAEILKDKGTFGIYANTENKKNDRVYASLVGPDAGNYEFEASEDGDLDATLYCYYKKTELTAKDDSVWGSFPMNEPVVFGDKFFTVNGEQGGFTDNLVDVSNSLKQLTFSVFAEETKIAEGKRIGIEHDGFEYQFIDSRFIEASGGPSDIEIDFIPNVAGYTDENGGWIYEGESLELTFKVTTEALNEVTLDINKVWFDGQLIDDAYLLATFSANGDSSWTFTLDDSIEAKIGIYKIDGNNLLENEIEEDGCFYASGSASYFLVVKVEKGGTGGIAIESAGL